MKSRLCLFVLAFSVLGCELGGEAQREERERPVIDSCRGWDNQRRLIVASGTVSVEIDGVPIPSSEHWNVAIDPIIRFDGHHIDVHACVPDFHYFEEADDYAWWDGWTFLPRWQLDGPVSERTATPPGSVFQPGMFAAMSKRKVSTNSCTEVASGQPGVRRFECHPYLDRYWFALRGHVGEMFVETWDPLDRKFKAYGWVQAVTGPGTTLVDDGVANIHISLDLTW